MKNNKSHTDFEKEFFSKTNIQYSKSKEDVWLDLESKLDDSTNKKVLNVNFSKYFKYSVAAVLVLSFGLLSFLKYYSTNVYCPTGQHSTVILPDGSKVTLNANSQLSYHPYWWNFNREIDFSGEAFFEVKKGKKFSVVSDKASTTVLGTSFNIFARNNNYEVHCISGKVKVESKNEESIILAKNEYSIIKKSSNLIKLKGEEDNKNSIAWINNEFIFTAAPLKEIFKEIERQFDIVIENKEMFNGTSTYTFDRGSLPEEIINNVGKPFGISCVKLSSNKYRLTKPEAN